MTFQSRLPIFLCLIHAVQQGGIQRINRAAKDNKILALRIVLVLCLGLITTTGHSAILSKLEQGSSLTISAIGTSLTGDASHSGNGLWFNKLGTWLNGMYPGKVTLDNEAWGGATSQTTPGTISRSGLGSQGNQGQLDYALANNPDAVFIEFGINDAVTQFVGMDQPVGITPAMLRNNLQTMIDEINSWAMSKSKSVDIILLTMNDEPTTGFRPNLPAYYQSCRDAATDNGLLLVDIYPAWIDLHNTEPLTWQSYVPGGVHPNQLGTDAIIMPNVERALLNQVPEPTILSLFGMGALGLVAYVWHRKA